MSGSGDRYRPRDDRPTRYRRRTDASGGGARRRRAAGPTVGPARRAGYQSQPGMAMRGYQLAVTGRDRDVVQRRDIDPDLGLRGAELGDDPAGPRERARELVGRADGHDRERVRERRRFDRHGARRTDGDDPGHDPDIVDRHRLGTRVAQLVDEILQATAVDRPVHQDRDTRTGRRVDARVQPDAAQVRAQLIDRRVAALIVLAEHRELPLERGDLTAELVITVVEIADQDGQVLRGQPGEGIAGGLHLELLHGQEAEQQRDRGDRQLVRSTAHRASSRSRARTVLRTVTPRDARTAT